MSLKLQKRQN